MNYQSLMDAIEGVATSLGYHPTLPENLHSTLRHEGFPIAILTPPHLLSIKGEREVKRVYDVEVKLLAQSGLVPFERTSSLALLGSDAERFAAALASHSQVREVELQEVAPIEQMLTIAGEVSFLVRAKVRCFECDNEC